jgi:hypothetical protein
MPDATMEGAGMSDPVNEMLERLLLGPNPFCDVAYAKDEKGRYLFCRRAPDHDGLCGGYE